MSHWDVQGTIVDIGINTTQFKVLVEFVVKSQIVLCALFLHPIRWLVHIVTCLGMELSGNDRCDDQGIDTLCLVAVSTEIAVTGSSVIRMAQCLCKSITCGMDEL